MQVHGIEPPDDEYSEDSPLVAWDDSYRCDFITGLGWQCSLIPHVPPEEAGGSMHFAVDPHLE